MANTTTSLMTASVRAKYVDAYIKNAEQSRIYDQMASPVGTDMSSLARGSSVTVPFISRLEPSTQTISETADIATSTVRDASVTITPTSRGNAVTVSELYDLQSFDGATQDLFNQMGVNAMESIEQLAIAILWANGLNQSYTTTRTSLDAGTSAHLLSADTFMKAAVLGAALKIPQFETPRGMRRMAIVHPYAYKDLFASGGIVQAVGAYQDKNMLLNMEVGELAGFAIVVSPWAKALWGAGAANASAVNTTLNGATKALDTSFTATANTNMVVGKTLTIGTVESSTTLYPTTEQVVITGIASTTISIAGSGPNGGFMYDHATLSTVKNTDNVFLAVFGTADSIAKVYNTETGEYGKVIMPKVDGALEQFQTTGWKFYGNYGKVSDARFIRVETASSMDA